VSLAPLVLMARTVRPVAMAWRAKMAHQAQMARLARRASAEKQGCQASVARMA
jgi:hypothetical protein